MRMVFSHMMSKIRGHGRLFLSKAYSTPYKNTSELFYALKSGVILG